MIDIIGAIVLTAIFSLVCAVLITSSPAGSVRRSWLVTSAAMWFAAVVSAAAMGVFSVATVGTPAIGIAVATPFVLMLVAATRSSAVRQAALGVPPAVLVALHAGRLLGIFFILLLAQRRLPPTFALTAGWGDIAIGLTALPLAWAIHRRAAGWKTLTLAWNAAGMADLIAAVTLGVGSAANSPLRFIFESSDSSTVASLPWVLIPAVLVPLYLLTHVAIFVQLARAIGETRQKRHASLAWEGSVH